MRFRHPFFPQLPIAVIGILAAIIIPTCNRCTKTASPTPAAVTNEPSK
ncbi:MAG: hypothetical protein ACAH89_03030 [Rariglobus sp.]|nr:hypothetical protein [Rariglobus sp.]